MPSKKHPDKDSPAQRQAESLQEIGDKPPPCPAQSPGQGMEQIEQHREAEKKKLQIFSPESIAHNQACKKSAGPLAHREYNLGPFLLVFIMPEGTGDRLVKLILFIFMGKPSVAHQEAPPKQTFLAPATSSCLPAQGFQPGQAHLSMC